MSFPLGTPKNRPPPAPALVPIPGRPNWFTDRAGTERYVEPPRPGIQDWTGRGFGGTVPPKKQ